MQMQIKNKKKSIVQQRIMELKQRKKQKEIMRDFGTLVMLVQETWGEIVTVELKTGQVYRGCMTECNDNWDCNLKQVVCTAKDGTESQLEEINITGDEVMFVGIPPIFDKLQIIQHMLMSKRQNMEPSNTSEQIILVKCTTDKQFVKVKQTVALQIHPLKVMIQDNIDKNPIYLLPGITRKTLCMVIQWCENHSFDVDSLDPIALFNLIQAAYQFKIKSLMELTCGELRQKLKKEMEDGKEKIKKIRKHSERVPDFVFAVAWRGPVRSNNNILRSHEKETFIMQLDLEDVQCSPFVAYELSFFNQVYQIPKIDAYGEVLTKLGKTRMTRKSMTRADRAQLSKSAKRLQKLVNGDPRLADHLTADVVRSLVWIIKSINFVEIELCCISILSCACFDKCGDVIEKEALPLFVGLMYRDNTYIVDEVVIALTRLAYAYPDCIQLIIKKGALEAAQKICSENGYKYDVAKDNLAKFLVSVCRGENLSQEKFTHDEISAILTILSELIKKKGPTIWRIVRACNALSYLSFERNVPRMNKAIISWLIGLISHKNPWVAGPALGVVGNIARWGTDKQIQILVKDDKFVQGLESNLLCHEIRMFQKEACQIITNMAARSKTFREHGLKVHLLTLLGVDEPDVKMEAAWSLLNSRYGDQYCAEWINKYDNDNLKAASVVNWKNDSVFTTLKNLVKNCDP